MKETIKKSIIWAITFFSTVLLLSFVYAAVGVTWTSPDTLEWTSWWPLSAANWNKLLANVNNLNTSVNNISSQQFLWFAEQNMALSVTNQTFTDFPWATLTFNLSTAKKVLMRAFWSVFITGSTSGPTWTNCWFRFVVDWIAYWHATWWDIITWPSSLLRSSRNMERILDLQAWTHIIKVQMKDRKSWYYWCMNDANDYWKTRLFVQTLN